MKMPRASPRCSLTYLLLAGRHGPLLHRQPTDAGDYLLCAPAAPHGVLRAAEVFKTLGSCALSAGARQVQLRRVRVCLLFRSLLSDSTDQPSLDCLMSGSNKCRQGQV